MALSAAAGILAATDNCVGLRGKLLSQRMANDVQTERPDWVRTDEELEALRAIVEGSAEQTEWHLVIAGAWTDSPADGRWLTRILA